jgi:hypothetical protein
VHDWVTCPFSHPGEKAKRRDPRYFVYTGIACPSMKKVRTAMKLDSVPGHAFETVAAAWRSVHTHPVKCCIPHTGWRLPAGREVPLRAQRLRVLAPPHQVGLLQKHQQFLVHGSAWATDARSDWPDTVRHYYCHYHHYNPVGPDSQHPCCNHLHCDPLHRYRTQLCNDGMGCRRRVCFFAHSLAQLRVPATKPFVPPEVLAALEGPQSANPAAVSLACGAARRE